MGSKKRLVRLERGLQPWLWDPSGKDRRWRTFLSSWWFTKGERRDCARTGGRFVMAGKASSSSSRHVVGSFLHGHFLGGTYEHGHLS